MGAAALAGPLAFGTAAPASAATASLTVTTLGGYGENVAGNAVYASNLGTGKTYSFQGGQKATVPAGRYAIVANIHDPDNSEGQDVVLGADSLVSRTVTVSGDTRATLDGQTAKSFRVDIDKLPTGYVDGWAGLLAQLLLGRVRRAQPT